MIRFHRNDSPADTSFGEAVAIDTETLGLAVGRDRLCVVQVSRGDGTADIVQIAAGQTSSSQFLERLLRPTRRSSNCSTTVVLTWRCWHHGFGVMARRLLHQDRLQARANLYRPAWPQGSDAGAIGGRNLQAAAIVRSGGRYAQRGAARLRRIRRPASAPLARKTRRHAEAARAGKEFARAAFVYLPDRVRLDLAGSRTWAFFPTTTLEPRGDRAVRATPNSCAQAIAAFCMATSLRDAPARQSQHPDELVRVNPGAPSADPSTATRPPAPVMTKFAVGVGGRVLAVARDRSPLRRRRYRTSSGDMILDRALAQDRALRHPVQAVAQRDASAR